MNGNVVLKDAECGLELLRVQEDVLTNKEVGRMFVILGEKIVQSIRSLEEIRQPTATNHKTKQKPTGSGPSSKLSAIVPVGASQISPGVTHLYVEEQTVAL